MTEDWLNLVYWWAIGVTQIECVVGLDWGMSTCQGVLGQAHFNMAEMTGSKGLRQYCC